AAGGGDGGHPAEADGIAGAAEAAAAGGQGQGVAAAGAAGEAGGVAAAAPLEDDGIHAGGVHGQARAVERHVMPHRVGGEGEAVVAGRAADGEGAARAAQGRVVEDGDGEGLLETVVGLVGAADAHAVGRLGGEVEGVGGNQLVAAE